MSKKPLFLKFGAEHQLNLQMATIQAVKARQISDSRGDPTVEVGVTLSDGTFTTAATTIASAASTAINVALELRAGGSDYLGKGFLKDVDYVNSIIAPALIGMDPTDQVKIDNLLQELAWTVNEWGWWFKGTLGPNAILAVSLAVRKAGAMVNKISLYEHTAILARNKTPLLPVPAFNVINGGYHAGNKLARQEFMILPIAASSFEEAIEMGVEVYQHLKAEIKNKYGQDVSDDGFEGRFTPNIQENKVVLGLLKTSIAKAGYTGKVVIGMVVDASYDNKHDLNLKKEGDQTGPRSFLSDYPIVSIEDPFDQDDSEHYAKMIVKIHEPVLIVDGALLVTDHKKNDKISGDSLKNVYKSFDDSDWEHYAKQIAEIREPIQIMCTACAEAKDDNDPASFHPCVNDLLLTCSKTKAGPIGRPSPVGSNDQFAAFRLF